MLRGLRAAVRFLTRLPFPGPVTQAQDLPRALPWFPLIGGLIGAGIGALSWHLTALWPAPIAAVLAVGIGMLVTGALHEDAVADSADGLGGGFTTERVLAILKDSRVGTYGVCALWCVLSLRVFALVSAGPQAAVVLAVAMAWGRWTALPLLRLPPLGTGLGQGIAKTITKDIAGPGGGVGFAIATVFTLGVTVAGWWAGLTTDVLVAAGVTAVALTAGWAWYLLRRLGGQSGDLLGAGNQLVEAGVLLCLLMETGP